MQELDVDMKRGSMKERIIIYGYGKCFESLYKHIIEEDIFEIIEIWDKDPAKWGILEDGLEVVAPKETTGGMNIIISSDKYKNEIRNELILAGISMEYIKPYEYWMDGIRKSIIEKYKDDPDEDIKSAVRYLENNDLCVFNYEDMKRECDMVSGVDIFLDNDTGLFFTYWNDKKMYIRRSCKTELQAKEYIKAIKVEQCVFSPHNYKFKDIVLNKEDVLVDGGAAEGFWALERVEDVKRIYIIESDPEWVEALNYTFAPYMDKVEIINKCLSVEDTSETITLDKLNEKDKISVVKLDIEGAETDVLENAKHIYQNERLIMVVCTYHKSNDAERIEKTLQQAGMITEFSRRYMCFIPEERVQPELRHGLIIGEKL